MTMQANLHCAERFVDWLTKNYGNVVDLDDIVIRLSPLLPEGLPLITREHYCRRLMNELEDVYPDRELWVLYVLAMSVSVRLRAEDMH